MIRYKDLDVNAEYFWDIVKVLIRVVSKESMEAFLVPSWRNSSVTKKERLTHKSNALWKPDGIPDRLLELKAFLAVYS